MTADLSADAYAVLGTGYDDWCHSVTEDIDFYVRLAIESGGPVLEIGVGSGRIAIPTALAGIVVVGVDRSGRCSTWRGRRRAPRTCRCDWSAPTCGRCPSWAASRW